MAPHGLHSSTFEERCDTRSATECLGRGRVGLTVPGDAAAHAHADARLADLRGGAPDRVRAPGPLRLVPPGHAADLHARTSAGLMVSVQSAQSTVVGLRSATRPHREPGRFEPSRFVGMRPTTVPRTPIRRARAGR